MRQQPLVHRAVFMFDQGARATQITNVCTQAIHYVGSGNQNGMSLSV